MIDASRHFGYFEATKFNSSSRVTIVGCGATGSALALNFARLGVKGIILIDDDKVEAHNVANQMYTQADIGLPKAEVLRNLCTSVADEVHYSLVERLPSKVKLSGHVFLCVDSMKSRKEIYEKCLKNNPNIEYLYDLRMGARAWEVEAWIKNGQLGRCIDDGGFRPYVESLFDDSDVLPDTGNCQAVQSIGATAATLASAATWLFMDIQRGSDGYGNKNKPKILYGGRITGETSPWQSQSVYKWLPYY